MQTSNGPEQQPFRLLFIISLENVLFLIRKQLTIVECPNPYFIQHSTEQFYTNNQCTVLISFQLKQFQSFYFCIFGITVSYIKHQVK